MSHHVALTSLGWLLPSRPLIIHTTELGRRGEETTLTLERRDRTLPAGWEEDGWELHPDDIGTGPHRHQRWLVPTWVVRTDCGRITYSSNAWESTSPGTALDPKITSALILAGLARPCQRCAHG